MISIYTDSSLIRECTNQNYLFPLLKILFDGSEVLAKEYNVCTGIGDAQILIFPIAVDYFLKEKKNKVILQNFIALGIKNNKKIIVFTSGDVGYTVKNKDVYTLRLGGFASKIKDKGFIMPPFINDPYIFLQKSESYRTKTSKPEIGFVGHSNGSVIKIVKEFILYLNLNFKRILAKECVDYQPFYPSSYFRHYFLTKLQMNNSLATHFIFRDKYRAGAKNEAEKHKTSLEFYENIHNNLYTFCMRGGGNFSVRLYETLAMGRIPIVLNTDCKFPFENSIDWQKNCIIVNENEKQQLSQRIVQYHEKHSNEEIIAIQKENRLLWKKYCTKTAFFLNFKNEILKII